jgi:hypothetical protein
MTDCCNPGCHRNDRQEGETLNFEYLPREDTWVPVCDRHLNEDNPNLELTDEVKETSAEVLTVLVRQVNE